MVGIEDNRKLLVVPALLGFIITCLLLFKFSYPISWDVYYHIHMTDLYLNNGLVFWDYSTVAPTGRLIMYPPLFHLFLASVCRAFNLDAFAVAWFMQPFFSFFLIFTIGYVSYRLSEDNVIVGVLTSFMVMMSFAAFNRTVLCTPATLAIAFSMLALLFYYESFNDNSFKKLILSAACFGLICNLHMATAIVTSGVLFLYSVYLIFSESINWKYILYYIVVSLVISCPWWLYISLNYDLVFNSLAGSYLRIDEFLVKYYGIIPSLFTFAGFYVLYKNWSQKAAFLMIWAVSIVILSQVPLLGFDTVSIRLLELSAYPLILIAGIGVYEVFDRINKRKLRCIFIVFFISYSLLASIAYVDSYTPDLLATDDYNDTILTDTYHYIFDPVGSTLKPSIISDRYANMQLAHDRHDIAQYLVKNNISGLIVSEDAVMDTIMVSSADVSVVYGGFTESIPEYVVDPVHIVNGQATLNELDSLQVKYILLRHNTPIPTYCEMEYKNDNYKLCKVVLK